MLTIINLTLAGTDDRGVSPIIETVTYLGNRYAFTRSGLPLGQPIVGRTLSIVQHDSGPDLTWPSSEVTTYKVRITFVSDVWVEHILDVHGADSTHSIRTSTNPTREPIHNPVSLALMSIMGNPQKLIEDIFTELTGVIPRKALSYMYRAVGCSA
jgi:hypothetical protein